MAGNRRRVARQGTYPRIRRKAAAALCITGLAGLIVAWTSTLAIVPHRWSPSSVLAALRGAAGSLEHLREESASATAIITTQGKGAQSSAWRDARTSLRRKLPPYDYAVAWLSDTQYYAQSYPRIFRQMTRFIANHHRELNIRYVVHTGDIVNRDQARRQWRRASDSMAVLDRAGIPYGVLAGNHDVNTSQPSYVQFSRYFGEQRFSRQATYGGSYLDNRGHYDLVRAGKQKLLFVYMGWEIGENELRWMERILKRHAGYRAILCLHHYMNAAGERSAVGEVVYERIVVRHPNVAAVLCGHEHNAALLVNYMDDNHDGTRDRTVYQLLADYQKGRLGGEGYMRLLLFDEQSGQLHVRTYSPLIGQFNYYKGELSTKDEFSLPWPPWPSA